MSTGVDKNGHCLPSGGWTVGHKNIKQDPVIPRDGYCPGGRKTGNKGK